MMRKFLQNAVLPGLMILGAGLLLIWQGHKANLELAFQNGQLRRDLGLLDQLKNKNNRLRATSPGPAALAAVREERIRSEAEIDQQERKLLDAERTRQAQADAVKVELDALNEKHSRGEVPINPTSFHQAPVSAAFSYQLAHDVGVETPEASVETWLSAIRDQNAVEYEQLRFVDEGRLNSPLQDYPDPGMAGFKDWFLDVTNVVLQTMITNGTGAADLNAQLQRNRASTPGEATVLAFQLQRVGNQWKVSRVGVRPDAP
jgi:hypothetical protein